MRLNPLFYTSTRKLHMHEPINVRLGISHRHCPWGGTNAHTALCTHAWVTHSSHLQGLNAYIFTHSHTHPHEDFPHVHP